MPTKPTTTAGQKRELRERMRAAGLDYRAIAAEFGRRYRLRPRAAWREAYGWSLAQAAEQINAFKGDVGLDPGGLCSMNASHLCEYENWPGAGEHPAGRRPTPYLLAVLSRVYACSVIDLLDLADREHTPPPDLLIIDTYTQDNHPASAPGDAGPDRRAPALPLADQDRQAILELRHGVLEVRQPAAAAGPAAITAALAVPEQAVVAYRGHQESLMGDSTVQREVLMAAHEGSGHAEQAGQPGVGEATFEQLHADVTRLARLVESGEPFAAFLDLRRVRDRIHRILEGRLWPREQTDLYFFLGCLNGLMAIPANQLGYPDAAAELNRAGWAYAHAIDHRPLMAQLRGELSTYAYYRGRYEESRDLALSGLGYLSSGPHAAGLHIYHARAAGRLGDADTARRAIRDAYEARDRDSHDELLEMGGIYLISEATHHAMAGSALTATAEHDAAQELEQAISLYDEGPRGRENHWFGGKPLAGIDLAAVRLRSGALDAAADALQPALSLPATQRISDMTIKLATVREELTASIFHGSPQARDLGTQIEEFGRDTIIAGLHSLPGGRG
jgi:tetratricopeptide (TPR) repeat protein